MNILEMGLKKETTKETGGRTPATETLNIPQETLKVGGKKGNGLAKAKA